MFLKNWFYNSSEHNVLKIVGFPTSSKQMLLKPLVLHHFQTWCCCTLGFTWLPKLMFRQALVLQYFRTLTMLLEQFVLKMFQQQCCKNRQCYNILKTYFAETIGFTIFPTIQNVAKTNGFTTFLNIILLNLMVVQPFRK